MFIKKTSNLLYEVFLDATEAYFRFNNKSDSHERK